MKVRRRGLRMCKEACLLVLKWEEPLKQAEQAEDVTKKNSKQYTDWRRISLFRVTIRCREIFNMICSVIYRTWDSTFQIILQVKLPVRSCLDIIKGRSIWLQTTKSVGSKSSWCWWSLHKCLYYTDLDSEGRWYDTVYERTSRSVVYQIWASLCLSLLRWWGSHSRRQWRTVSSHRFWGYNRVGRLVWCGVSNRICREEVIGRISLCSG